ncbi:RebB family R body protein [Pseudoalteromonas denitrificans]|uniref:Killing trait domain-containing protein n=1 Tax=Pseudoalteromonas denitrificans DSM 6059 TaxID=1123010 RepID=A0A1I1SZ21_9GAMM|nr:RebB family R body protein [Pseudoalteromonas denitrificans]SFD51704.1 Killing trait domain-containing protein [Pseudoalteromonas denitrificans DSM 6059]
MNSSDSDETKNSTAITTSQRSVFSNQPTGLVETTFAETLGLSMHNAISNQQNSQMTTAASITNACARLLQAPIPPPPKPVEPPAEPEESKEPEVEPEPEPEPEPKPKKKRFNILNFLKGKKNKSDESGDS